MSDFSGHINKNIDRPISYQDWKNKANNHPQLLANNDIIVNKSNYIFIKYASILLFIILASSLFFFFYFVNEDKFKSEINQEINPHFNSTTNNQFDFNCSQQTYNDYEIKLNVSLILSPNITLYNNLNITQ